MSIIISAYRFMLGRIIGIKDWNMDLGRCLHEIYNNSNATRRKQITQSTKDNNIKLLIRVIKVLKSSYSKYSSTSGQFWRTYKWATWRSTWQAFWKLHFRMGVLQAFKGAGRNCHFATSKYGIKYDKLTSIFFWVQEKG